MRHIILFALPLLFLGCGGAKPIYLKEQTFTNKENNSSENKMEESIREMEKETEAVTFETNHTISLNREEENGTVVFESNLSNPLEENGTVVSESNLSNPLEENTTVVSESNFVETFPKEELNREEFFSRFLRQDAFLEYKNEYNFQIDERLDRESESTIFDTEEDKEKRKVAFKKVEERIANFQLYENIKNDLKYSVAYEAGLYGLKITLDGRAKSQWVFFDIPRREAKRLYNRVEPEIFFDLNSSDLKIFSVTLADYDGRLEGDGIIPLKKVEPSIEDLFGALAPAETEAPEPEPVLSPLCEVPEPTEKKPYGVKVIAVPEDAEILILNTEPSYSDCREIGIYIEHNSAKVLVRKKGYKTKRETFSNLEEGMNEVKVTLQKK
jgi:hypothetical protein